MIAAEVPRRRIPAIASAYSTFAPGRSSWSTSGCGEAPATHTAARSSQQALSQLPKFLRSRTGSRRNRHVAARGISILRYVYEPFRSNGKSSSVNSTYRGAAFTRTDASYSPCSNPNVSRSPSFLTLFAEYVVRLCGWMSFSSLSNGRSCVTVRTGVFCERSAHSSPVAFKTSDFTHASSPTTKRKSSFSIVMSAAYAPDHNAAHAAAATNLSMLFIVRLLQLRCHVNSTSRPANAKLPATRYCTAVGENLSSTVMCS